MRGRQSFHRYASLPSVVWLAIFVGPPSAVADAPDAKAAQKDRLTITGRVLDAETGVPIRKFVVVSGTSPIERLGWQWQGHTAQEFSDGKLEWPPPGLAGFPEQVLRIEADGYIPYQSELIKHVDSFSPGGPMKSAAERFQGEEAPVILVRPGEPVPLEFRLERDPGIGCRVLSARGEPVAGADIAVVIANDQFLHFENGKIEIVSRLPGRLWPRVLRHIQSDKDGRFRLPSEIERAVVAVTHSSGVSIQTLPDIKSTPNVQLKPWGKIEGQVLWGDTPGSKEEVALTAHGAVIAGIQTSTTDGDGRFSFDFVPPGSAAVTCQRPSQTIDVVAGQTTNVVIGGKGRPVVGKLIGRETWDGVKLRILLIAPPRVIINGRGGEQVVENRGVAAHSKFMLSPAAKNYTKMDIPVAADGTFRIDDVPPESYALYVEQVNDRGGKTLIGSQSFRVLSIPGGKTDEPQELKPITVRTQIARPVVRLPGQ